MKPRVTQITVVPEGEPIFAECGYTINIVDEAAGEFLEIEDHATDNGYGKIGLNVEDWPALRRAINKMVKNCRPKSL